MSQFDMNNLSKHGETFRANVILNIILRLYEILKLQKHRHNAGYVGMKNGSPLNF